MSKWFSVIDYGDPLIIAAENGGDGSHCTTTITNNTNNTNSTLHFEFEDSSNTTTTRTCSGDAHVAQGVAFFLQNFFILLRLVFHILHTHVQLKTTIKSLVFNSTLIFKFGRTEEDPDSF